MKTVGCHERLTVRQLHQQIPKRETRLAVSSRGLDGGAGGCLRLRRTERGFEAIKPSQNRGPLGKLPISADEKRERPLNAAEGFAGLDDRAELNLSGKIGRRYQ